MGFTKMYSTLIRIQKATFNSDFVPLYLEHSILETIQLQNWSYLKVETIISREKLLNFAKCLHLIVEYLEILKWVYFQNDKRWDRSTIASQSPSCTLRPISFS